MQWSPLTRVDVRLNTFFCFFADHEILYVPLLS